MKKIFNSFEEINFVREDNSLKTIGTGGFASVYKIYHQSNPNKFYALKRLRKKDELEIRYIKQELQVHSGLQHENIIQFYQHFENSKYFFFVLEFAQKQDLFEYMRSEEFTVDKGSVIFWKICQGIQYLHSRKVLHRDLKPENILLNQKLEPKICDFGWSALYHENQRRLSMCGTREYMGYEIFDGKDQSYSTDVWALGIILYEIYHGRTPFRSKVMNEYIRRIKYPHKFIKFSTDCPLDVQKLLKRILVANPNKRPSIEQILESDFLKRVSLKYKKVQEISIKIEQPKQNFIKEIKTPVKKIINMFNASTDSKEFTSPKISNEIKIKFMSKRGLQRQKKNQNLEKQQRKQRKYEKMKEKNSNQKVSLNGSVDYYQDKKRISQCSSDGRKLYQSRSPIILRKNNIIQPSIYQRQSIVKESSPSRYSVASTNKKVYKKYQLKLSISRTKKSKKRAIQIFQKKRRNVPKQKNNPVSNKDLFKIRLSQFKQDINQFNFSNNQIKSQAILMSFSFIFFKAAFLFRILIYW